jgi:hypothetical protein
VWVRLNEAFVKTVWGQDGREPKPSATIIDSQSVKTAEGGEQRGIDIHKQTPGRKRHIVVDTLALLLLVVIHRARIQDGSGSYHTPQTLDVLGACGGRIRPDAFHYGLVEIARRRLNPLSQRLGLPGRWRRCGSEKRDFVEHLIYGFTRPHFSSKYQDFIRFYRPRACQVHVAELYSLNQSFRLDPASLHTRPSGRNFPAAR